jgi:hypothetical protein
MKIKTLRFQCSGYEFCHNKLMPDRQNDTPIHEQIDAAVNEWISSQERIRVIDIRFSWLGADSKGLFQSQSNILCFVTVLYEDAA